MQTYLYNRTPWTVWAPGCAFYRVRVNKLLSKLLLCIKKEVGNTFKQKEKPHHFRPSWILGQWHCWESHSFIWLFRQFHPLPPPTMWQQWVTLELTLHQFKENSSIAWDTWRKIPRKYSLVTGSIITNEHSILQPQLYLTPYVQSRKMSCCPLNF